MKTRLLFPFCVCLALASCDRASKLIAKAKATVTQEEEKETKKDDTSSRDDEVVPIDPELAALIDQTDEGVLFRRDLPFPKEVSVTITEKEPMAVRLFQQSEVGRQNSTFSAVRQLSMEIQRTPGSVLFSDFKEEFFEEKNVAGNMTQVAIQGHPLLSPLPPKDHTMVFQKDKWGAMPNVGFAAAALAQQLGPHMPSLLQEYGLSPRLLWFGKRRIAPGKPMDISGELLPMLVAGKATGELTITLEKIESVKGHPCGRFAIKGSYLRERFPAWDGRLFDEETSIQSGTIWMSVLHPLVLQYRVDRIVTLSVAEGNGPAIRIQGNSSPTRTIEWRAGE